MAKLQTEYEVVCPCCQATLVIDAGLRRVVRHVEAERADRPKLDDAHRILVDRDLACALRERGHLAVALIEERSHLLVGLTRLAAGHDGVDLDWLRDARDGCETIACLRTSYDAGLRALSEGASI